MNDVVGFNSRAHGGRDFSTSFDDWLTGVSIHAPTGGATRWLNRLALVHAVSIHAPTGGATDSAHRVSRRPSFNSRAHGGATSCGQLAYIVSVFQFTRPRGARRRAKP